MGNKLSRAWILVIAAAAIVTLVLAIYARYFRIPPFSGAPVTGSSPALTNSDAEKLFGQSFRLVWHVRQIPATIKQSFVNATNLPFDMNNSGDPLSTDLILPGVPSRQLILAGVGQDSAFVVWKQGGYADTFHVVVFSFAGKGGRWKASLNGPVEDISALRSAVHNGQFRVSTSP